MADPATNTAYPEAIEALPAIASGARMIDPDVRHDQVHDRAHATLNAIQALLGTTVDADPNTVLARVAQLVHGGILVQCGAKSDVALAIPTGTEVSGIAPSGYRITGWRLWCYPAATIAIDVRRDSFENLPPTEGDSITGASPPLITSGISSSAEVGSDWGATISRGDALTAVVTANSGATWFALLLLGDKA